MGNGSSKSSHRNKSKHATKEKTPLRSNSYAGATDFEIRGSEMHRAMTDSALDVDNDFHDSSTPNLIDQNSNGISFNPKLKHANGDIPNSTCTKNDKRNEHESMPSTTMKNSETKTTKTSCSDSITCSELYNLIIAETWQGRPQIHDSDYLLIVDCREKPTYEKLHIITSRHHSALYSEYKLLMPSQLKLFQIIILYSESSSCKNICEVSKKLSEDEVEHYLLQNGSSEFFKKYPFLFNDGHYLTSDMRDTLQTMPSEILPGRLYQGNAKHALDSYIVTSLGITHIVNVTLEHPNRFEDTVKYLRIQLDDRPQVDLHAWLPRTSEFIQSAIGIIDIKKQVGKVIHNEDAINNKSAKGAVLVHCNLGRSRSSTVVLGYLMQACKLSLGEASNLLKDCRSTVRPNIGFLEQLLKYETEVFGKSVTELNDLPF